MGRVSLGLGLVAFLVVGFVGWLAGMPKPAQPEAGWVNEHPLPQVVSTEQAPASPAPAGTGQRVAAASSAVAGSGLDGWLTQVAEVTGIPARALAAYAQAAIAQQKATATCGLGWNTLAAIGEVESGHGSHDGASLDADGRTDRTILGPVLDGTGWAALRDTDDGALDGDVVWDRAVGPMQFLPSTWRAFATDGDGDGQADPNDIDDAARTAAAYLCAGGRDLTTADGWTAAIHAYNPSDDYAAEVAVWADRYAEAAGG